MHRDEILPLLSDPDQPIIRPANYPKGTPGLGQKYIKGVLVISLLGAIVGKDSNKPVDNPLKCIDKILADNIDKANSGIVVNFHGDYSSEKVIIGHYLDKRVTAVIGDHWHIPTNDARILPGGTAHISDVGMCGTLDSSLGITFDSVIPRWRDHIKTRNVLEINGQKQFNAVLIETNSSDLAESVETIRIIK
jgi:calcineurin-like phosphoesterase